MGGWDTRRIISLWQPSALCCASLAPLTARTALTMGIAPLHRALHESACTSQLQSNTLVTPVLCLRLTRPLAPCPSRALSRAPPRTAALSSHSLRLEPRAASRVLREYAAVRRTLRRSQSMSRRTINQAKHNSTGDPVRGTETATPDRPAMRRTHCQTLSRATPLSHSACGRPVPRPPQAVRRYPSRRALIGPPRCACRPRSVRPH